MEITYTDEKKFTKEQTQQLFRSVGWVSGKYPERLYKALMGSSTVFSAWDGDLLVGLVRVLDDTEMVAYMHYVLVDPEYQGHGIAGHLVGMVKERYRDYLYIEVMPEESKNATFYQKTYKTLWFCFPRQKGVNKGTIIESPYNDIVKEIGRASCRERVFITV